MNRLYPKGKEALLRGLNLADVNTSFPACYGTTPDYVYSDAHQFLSEIDTGFRFDLGGLTSASAVGGVLEGSDFGFNNYVGSPYTGNRITAVVLASLVYDESGLNESLSPLVAFYDTLDDGSPLDVTFNAGDFLAHWSPGPYKTLAL